MRIVIALLVMLPALARAELVRSRPFVPQTAKTVQVQVPRGATVANGVLDYGHVPWVGAAGARLVNVIIYQNGNGNGTSLTVDVLNYAGTSLLTTTANLTAASGANTITDSKGEVGLPSGWTRPVLKTDSTLDVATGDRLTVKTVETGTYSTHASLSVTLVFEPKQ